MANCRTPTQAPHSGPECLTYPQSAADQTPLHAHGCRPGVLAMARWGDQRWVGAFRTQKCCRRHMLASTSTNASATRNSIDTTSRPLSPCVCARQHRLPPPPSSARTPHHWMCWGVCSLGRLTGARCIRSEVGVVRCAGRERILKARIWTNIGASTAAVSRRHRLNGGPQAARPSRGPPKMFFLARSRAGSNELRRNPRPGGTFRPKFRTPPAPGVGPPMRDPFFDLLKKTPGPDSRYALRATPHPSLGSLVDANWEGSKMGGRKQADAHMHHPSCKSGKSARSRRKGPGAARGHCRVASGP